VSLRRAAAAVASTLLLLLLLSRDGSTELGRRVGILVRSASLDSNTRRFHGTATAFDRQFYVFLESVRSRLPRGAGGVAVLGVPRTDQVFYLATYHLAPIPVLVAPEQVPHGWLLAVYGPDRPPGWKVVTPVWRGALMAPVS
jgi:hypothetical protein